MRLIKLLSSLLLCSSALSGQVVHYSENEAATIRNIYSTALNQGQGYLWLKELTEIGPRLSGDPRLNEAIDRFKEIADSLGFKTHIQEVKVPRWIRGEQEVATFTSNGKTHELSACALGGSVSTSAEGLQGELYEISSFEQLDSITDELKGKIAFLNIPMDPSFINTFFAYSNTAKMRYLGAVEASKHGAIGVVTRSLSTTINPYPHTGSMTYTGAEKKIPAMAISTLDAEWLSKELTQNPAGRFYMKMNCREQDSVMSGNLVAEIRGSEKPEEVIVIGGHIDSWDLGTGAHDDGAGCMHALEAAWLLQKLQLPLKRTLRVVFFVNEEFGLSGARTYAEKSKEEAIKHTIAIESDAGGFTPRGISIVGPDSLVSKIRSLRELFEPYGLHQFTQTGAGADISQLMTNDIVMLGLRPDSHRYFDLHHASTDRLDAVSPRELEMGSATLASFIYLMDKYDITAYKADLKKN